MMKDETKTLLLSWIILLTLVLTWGSSFILMKKGLLYFSWDEVGSLRMVISGLFLLPFSIHAIRKLSREQILWLFLVGIFANAGPAFLFSYAQTGIDSSLAGILNSLTPLSTLIIGLSIFKYKAKWYNILGVLIGFIGVFGLLRVSGGNSFDFNFKYAKYIIVATLCYATSINIVKYKLAEVNPLALTSIALLFVGAPISIYLFGFTDYGNQILCQKEALKGMVYVSTLAIVCTALALIAFNHLIKISNVVFSASVTYLIPVVAVLWGI